jgi:hypothetical protein
VSIGHQLTSRWTYNCINGGWIEVGSHIER